MFSEAYCADLNDKVEKIQKTENIFQEKTVIFYIMICS